jgi:hypothetical protein
MVRVEQREFVIPPIDWISQRPKVPHPVMRTRMEWIRIKPCDSSPLKPVRFSFTDSLSFRFLAWIPEFFVVKLTKSRAKRPSTDRSSCRGLQSRHPRSRELAEFYCLHSQNRCFPIPVYKWMDQEEIHGNRHSLQASDRAPVFAVAVA